VNPPRFLFLTINEVCNLRCQHCRYWQSRRTDQIPVERQLEVVEEFAELSPGGNVVICGGEPMLDEDAYFAVCATSRRLGLQTLSVVNGTRIRDEEEARRVVTLGPDEVSVSIDHPDPRIHDEVRGVEGSHSAAVRAVELLLRARAGNNTPRIYVMGLLCRSTYQHLDDFYRLVLRVLGADKLKLNALQPTFLCTRGTAGQEPEVDDFFERESQVDPDVLRDTLLRYDAEYDLRINPAWVDQVVSYFRVLWQAPAETLRSGWTCGLDTADHTCDSPDRNIMVDLDGRASLCFSRAFRQQLLSRPGDMREFWKSSSDVREEMSTCNKLCGISHSVRSTSATLRRT
jgi:MoaA/NifB/PqqE/SkfB family radical SAM enzyme